MKILKSPRIYYICDCCGKHLTFPSDFIISISYGSEDPCWGTSSDEAYLLGTNSEQREFLLDCLNQEDYHFCDECRSGVNHAKAFEYEARATRTALLKKLFQKEDDMGLSWQQMFSSLSGDIAAALDKLTREHPNAKMNLYPNKIEIVIPDSDDVYEFPLYVLRRDKMIPLQAWATSHEPSDEMRWKQGYWNQILFVRDTLTGLLAHGEEDTAKFTFYRDLPKVVSTHTSKSITLPVFYMKWQGIVFYLRYNFYDWKISVDATEMGGLANIDFEDLVENISYEDCFFEGFSKEWVFKSWFEDPAKFSIELYSNYDVYCFFRKIWFYVRKQNIIS